MFIEVILEKQKWLIGFSYPHISSHLKHLQESLGRLANDYDRLLLLGDLNCSLEKQDLYDFRESNNLKGLLDFPTCFKNLDNPSCIDHMLTNFSECFTEASTVETGISDFHKTTFSVFKNNSFNKLPPKEITYRYYRKFNNESFELKLDDIMSMGKLSFASKLELIRKKLDEQAPIKTKILRGKQFPFHEERASKSNYGKNSS